jgi:cytochrome c-type biogenesis protein CcmF
LWGAVVAGLVSVLPGIQRRIRSAAVRVSAALALVATLVLVIALLVGDYSVVYVAETTSRATPWPYRLAALWGGMDGSMLFYATLTLGIGAFAIGRIQHRGVFAGIIGLVGTGYLLITALAANPFATLDIPAVDGRGLLAILQHPAMIYHPPILYTGLAVLVVPFALTVESRLERGLDRPWIRSARRWLMISWALLTLGMLAGANWAYVELGWGGFWAWDPVENTALMPWLATTVFIHTSRIQERDGRLTRWNAFFALLPFALSVLGVYLTRSGVTGSIHSFAENPVIGRTLLSAAVVVLVSATLVAARSPGGAHWEEFGTRRDTWLLVSGGLISTSLVFVAVGSAYPAYAQVFFGEAVTIDSRFFATTIYPVAALAGVLMAFALDTQWSRLGVKARAVVNWLVLLSAIGFTGFLVFDEHLISLLLIAIGGSGVLALVHRMVKGAGRGRAVAAHLAHLGLLMLLIGVGGSALGAEFRGVMAPGESVQVGGHTFGLTDVETGEEGRFLFVRARFEIDSARELEPEIRAYEDQTQPVSEPDLHSTPLRDVIVAISRLSPDGETVSVSVFVRPMVWWVWAGALVMTIAGLIALFGRSGAVSTRRRVARAARQSTETTSDTFAL